MKRMLFLFLISIIVIGGILAVTGHFIQAQSAQGAGDSVVNAKLDEALHNQRAMMEELAAIREELKIIKIRVTQSQ